jgi:hypothetical protein
MRDDVGSELLELFVLRDKVRLAEQLDHRGFGSGYESVARRTLRAALLDATSAFDSQQLTRLVEVTINFFEGTLGVHHSGAGGVAELLYLRGGNRGLSFLRVLRLL